MKEGDIVYHINCGSERFRIRKTDGELAVLDQIDEPMTRRINGEMCYRTQICNIENLLESLENTNQLSLF